MQYPIHTIILIVVPLIGNILRISESPNQTMRSVKRQYTLLTLTETLPHYHLHEMTADCSNMINELSALYHDGCFRDKEQQHMH